MLIKQEHFLINLPVVHFLITAGLLFLMYRKKKHQFFFLFIQQSIMLGKMFI